MPLVTPPIVQPGAKPPGISDTDLAKVLSWLQQQWLKAKQVSVQGDIDANNVTARGMTTAQTYGGHIVSKGGMPAFGSLRTGVATQAFSTGSTDVAGSVSILTAGGGGPANGAQIFAFAFANPYPTPPAAMVQSAGVGLLTCAATTTTLTIFNSQGSAIGASYNFSVNYIVIG